MVFDKEFYWKTSLPITFINNSVVKSTTFPWKHINEKRIYIFVVTDLCNMVRNPRKSVVHGLIVHSTWQLIQNSYDISNDTNTVIAV